MDIGVLVAMVLGLEGVRVGPERLASAAAEVCAVGGSSACGGGDWSAPEQELARIAPLLAPACDAGDTPACTAAGYLLTRDLHGRLQPGASGWKGGLARLEGACAAGSARACGERGWIALFEADVRDVAELPAEALAAIGAACDGGDVASCLRSGRASSEGWSPPDLASARWQAACAAGSPAGCAAVSLAGLGVDDPPSEAAARPDLERACLAGAVNACGWLTRRDHAETWLPPLERACAAGEREACASLFDPASLTADDPFPGFARAIAACGAGEMQACFDLAGPFREKGASDLTEAASARCALGDDVGCFLAAWGMERGEVDYATATAIAALNAQVCGRGVSAACLRAARTAGVPFPGLPVDATRGERVLAACRMGAEEACDVADRVLAAGPGIAILGCARREDPACAAAAPTSDGARRPISPVKRVWPEFPEAARAVNITSATCILLVRIDPRGAPRAVVPADCPAYFVASAEEAVMKWRFEAPDEPAIFKLTIKYVLN